MKFRSEKRLISEKRFDQKYQETLIHKTIIELEYEQLNALNVKNDVSLTKVNLTSNYNERNESINDQQLNFKAKVHLRTTTIKIMILIDTNAFERSFVNVNFVKQHKLFTIELRKSIKLRLTNNKSIFNITHMTQVRFSLDTHIDEIWYLVTKLERYSLILDMSWLEEHVVNIKLETRAIEFFNFDCIVNCLQDHRFTTIYSSESQSQQIEISRSNNDTYLMFVWVFSKMIEKNDNDVVIMWLEHFETLNQFETNDKYLIKNLFFISITIIFFTNYEKFHDKMNKSLLTRVELKKQISINHHSWIECWDFREVNKLSSHKESDHRIDLQSNAISSIKKTYEISREQIIVIEKYIDDMMSKSFIRRNHARYAASIFIVKKSDEKFRVCVDYRALNALIVKNKNASLLIRDTLTRLCSIKIYIKFDIITTFNDIRVRESDQKKTIFIIRYDFYEYVMMIFEFCNVSKIFQSFINETLRKYLNVFCIVYIDNILIYSNSNEKHQIHVHQVLDKLRKANIYLNIKKC